MLMLATMPLTFSLKFSTPTLKRTNVDVIAAKGTNVKETEMKESIEMEELSKIELFEIDLKIYNEIKTKVSTKQRKRYGHVKA